MKTDLKYLKKLLSHLPSIDSSILETLEESFKLSGFGRERNNIFDLKALNIEAKLIPNEEAYGFVTGSKEGIRFARENNHEALYNFITLLYDSLDSKTIKNFI